MTEDATWLNEAPELELREALATCLDVPRWVDAVIAGRPYRDAAEVLDAARQAARPLTDDEIDRALSHHPRIGERPADDVRGAELSRREQSGVDPADVVMAERLREGNVAYESRFGRVFLIRAAGRSSADILAALHERLSNAPAQERHIVAAELRDIAVVRLKGVLGR